MPEGFEIPDNLDPEVKKIIEKGTEGPDRSKDSVGKNISDTKKDEEDAIYGELRKKDKKRREREAKKIKRSVREAELAGLQSMRKSGVNDPREVAGEILGQ